MSALLSLFLQRPQLVVNHLSSYAQLAQIETQEWLSHTRRLWLTGVGAALGTLLTLLTGSMALMLWPMYQQSTTLGHHAAYWPVLVPGVFFFLTVMMACIYGYLKRNRPAFEMLKAQLHLDATHFAMSGDTAPQQPQPQSERA